MSDDATSWFRRRALDVAADQADRAYDAWNSLRADRPTTDVPPELMEVSAAADGKRYPKLHGRPGLPSMVAGAANAITDHPNSRAGIPVGPGVTVRRGANDDITASVLTGGASGHLAPPDQSGGVEIDGIHPSGWLPGVSLPQRVRIFNGPDGRLMYEIHPGFSAPGYHAAEGVHEVP